MQDFPTGHALADTTPAERPATSDHQGHFIELTLVDAARDADALYAATHGDDADPGQWTYMGYGPFADAGAMATWMRTLETSTVELSSEMRRFGVGETGRILHPTVCMMLTKSPWKRPWTPLGGFCAEE